MMEQHVKFRLRTPEAFQEAIVQLGLDIRWQADLSPLAQPVSIGPFTVPNALAVQPMEGCDGQANGSPEELTVRRYLRFAGGGAGLLWFEATAVDWAGRANPRQLWIHRENVDSFASLVERARMVARTEAGHNPVMIMQLTHSGRYSKPDKPMPLIAYHHPYLPAGMTDAGLPVVTDDTLEGLEERYVEAASLAQRAGFDGVDVKACHRYLVNELLSGHTREGRYGGSLENRTRFLLNVVNRIRDRVGKDFLIGVRLNVYDGIPFPYGFGVDQNDHRIPDLAEPIRLVQLLRERGVNVVNVTAGNPYYNPHIGRPFDDPTVGTYLPDEHPLTGVARLVGLCREIQQAVPDMVTVGTGYSWLRHHLGNVAAAHIAAGWTRMIGVGREAFAYPTFARDLLTHGEMRFQAACITCSKCTQIMRDGSTTGCVPHDKAVYQSIYDQGRKGQLLGSRSAMVVGQHL